MIISIGGIQGSGKSTLAQDLARKLGWPRYYMGGLRREKAKSLGMTLAEYNKLGENDPKTDLEIDEYQKKLGETEDNFIIEGRTSWHFIPNSLKIYLDTDPKMAAKRIFSDLLDKNNQRNEGNVPKNWEEVFQKNLERYESDKMRYKKYFNIDVYNPKNYDFYLDTTNLTEKQVFEIVYKYISEKIDK